MADPLIQSGAPVDGQASPAPAADTGADAGIPVTEPTTVDSGQAAAPATPAEDSFFDASSLSPELMPAYKEMQGAFTRKTQAIAADRRKVEEYDRFMADPSYRAQLAAQFGIGAPAAEPTAGEFEPATWEDVLTKAEERAYQRFMGEMQPMLQEVRGVKRTQIERDLDEHVPEWRQYENEMTETLTRHPTLSADPVMLARLALPEHVLESKAMQAALKKLAQKSSGASVGKASTKAAPDAGADIPRARRSFQDAYKIARAKVADTLKAG